MRIRTRLHTRGTHRNRSANRHVQLPIVSELCFCKHGLSPVQRHDVGVDLEAHYRSCSVGKLLHDEDLCSSVLVHHQQKCVPDDTLQNHGLHGETAGASAIHCRQERRPHDKRVGKSSEHEDRNHPVKGTGLRVAHPECKGQEKSDLRHGIGSDEAEVHGIRIVTRDELEGEQRDGEDGDEAVHAHALLRRQDPPPFHGSVSEQHRHVKRHHCTEHTVQIASCNHLCGKKKAMAMHRISAANSDSNGAACSDVLMISSEARRN